MARSRRDLAILARIGAKFRNFTPTYPHPDVFALGKVADFAPWSLGILRIAIGEWTIVRRQVLLSVSLLETGRVVAPNTS